MNIYLALALTVFLLAANAFFVGAEFALISARRTVIEPLAKEGDRAARTTLFAMEHVSLMLAGAQLGITICTLGLGALSEPAVAHLLEGPFETVGMPHSLQHPVAFAIAMTLIVFLHVVAGEMVPKNIALAVPDRAALLLAPPLVMVVRILKPVIWLMNAIANALLRLVGIQARDEVTSAFTRDEVSDLVSESRREGLLDPQDEQLLLGALTFEERTAGTIMVPVARVQTVSHGASIADVERLATTSGFSRFPVRDTTGEMVGYIHIKDLLTTDPAARHAPLSSRMIRPLSTVQTTARLRDALRTMQRSGAHLARVVDETNSVVGVVVLEDVLEELVGDIRHETVTSQVQARGNLAYSN